MVPRCRTWLWSAGMGKHYAGSCQSNHLDPAYLPSSLSGLMPFSSWGTMLIFVVILPPFSGAEHAAESSSVILTTSCIVKGDWGQMILNPVYQASDSGQ